MFVVSTHLQHVLLAGFLLGGPAQRRPPQVHRELWDNLISLVLSGEKKAPLTTFSVKLINQSCRSAAATQGLMTLLGSCSIDWLLCSL